MTMIEHAAKGDPCEKCGAPASKHRKKRASRAVYFKEYDQKENRKARKRNAYAKPIIGIDGEGVTTPEGLHLYTYLAAVDENGKVWAEKWNSDGLSHEECCDVLLSLPRDSLKFGYMITYDMTKIMESLPMVDRYTLMRPDERKRRTCQDCGKSWVYNKKECPKCASVNLRERNQFVLNGKRAYDYQQGVWIIKEGKMVEGTRKWDYNVKIWDCFRFFQCSFVDALNNWGVGTKEQRDRILSMKVQRGTFIENDPKEIMGYCKEECELLAQMMRKVIDAHEEIDLDLKGQFQGAGSSASALLKKNEVTQYKTPDFNALDPRLQVAVMHSFFGGRFENSVVGIVRQSVWGYDIASAYPYAETFLPCLVCGYWEHVQGRGVLRAIEEADLACCHYRVADVSENKRKQIAWMPLPFRDDKGSICYPVNCTGWAWKPELLSALRGWGELVTVDEAWVYRTDCDHQPFAFIPEEYMNRVRWGKEGKGITLKLAMNATYGKTAQNVGKKPFNDWIWAGNTTAHTRGQINDLISSYSDPWNVCSIATDGIYGLEKVETPVPTDTGTFGLVDAKGEPKMALGGWEEKEDPHGLFIAKPGLYFSLREDIKQKDVRARGIGRRDTFEQRQTLIEGFNQWDRQNYDYAIELDTRRFCGIKNSIYAISRCSKCGTHWPGTPRKLCPTCKKVGDDFEVKYIKKDDIPTYGRWFDLKAKIRFDPRPKRERSLDKSGESSRMYIRNLGGEMSRVYQHGILSPEALEGASIKEVELEQPDLIEE